MTDLKNTFLILMFLACMVLSFAGGFYLNRPKEVIQSPDREAEIKALVLQLEQSEKGEAFHKNRADRAEHAADSLSKLKKKIDIRYYEKDRAIVGLNADSTHLLLLSIARFDSIWK